jgi:dCTP deaminase
MTVLTDQDLVKLVEGQRITFYKDPPKDWYDKNSPVQPSSIDFHIGKIFVPEVKPERRGGFKNPKSNSHTLTPGGTVLVETEEELDVPKNIAGFGFPPASTAVKGLLMTNPGHIDPGFKGRLTFTLINMGRDPFTIRQGDVLFTTLWIKLSMDVKKDYFARQGITAKAKEENIDVLSKDFLNVDSRAKKIAKGYITWAAIIAFSISALATWVQYALTTTSSIKKDIDNLKSSMRVLEVKLEERSGKEVAALEKTTDNLKMRIEILEKLQGKKANP